VAIGFSTAMIVGAFAYDPDVVNGLLGRINPNWSLSEALVIRLPVALTFLTAIICFLVVIGLYDLDRESGAEGVELEHRGWNWRALGEAFRQIRAAAGWTLNHRFVLFVILAALALDSAARQFVILASEYWRAIDIPVSWFGFIGAGLSLLGIINARISSYLVNNHSPMTNFLVLSAILMVGLTGLSFAIPYWGVVFAIGAFAMMSMVQFQSSFYINHEVDSARRATVLSFKGLALNLGLGLASFLYTALVAGLRGRVESTGGEQQVFIDSLAAFPVYYLLLFVLLILLGRIFIRERERLFKKPG
jgi:hypothetical protein